MSADLAVPAALPRACTASILDPFHSAGLYLPPLSRRKQAVIFVPIICKTISRAGQILPNPPPGDECTGDAGLQLQILPLISSE